MDRTELTIVAAAALMVALGLGWVLRWIYSLLNPPPPPAPKADSEWAEYARACEAQRDEALGRLTEVEGELGTKLTQAYAELSAAMEGLGAARRTTQELEARLAEFEAMKPGVQAPVPDAPEEPSAPQSEEGVPATVENLQAEAAESAPVAEATAFTLAMPESAPEQTVAETAETEPEAEATRAVPAEAAPEADDATEKAEAPEPAEAPDQADVPDAGSPSAGTEPAGSDAAPQQPETREPDAKPKRPRRRSTRGGPGAKRSRRSSTKTGNGA